MTNSNYQNMRFLIVDNIKPSQEILKQYLMRSTSKHVDSTHYAQDVSSICQQKSYDVIILGYDLGDNQKNGQQILEDLRVNKYISRQCIVILITAEVSQAMVLAALEHKPDHYLCKPYSLSDLEKRLKQCLNKKEAMSSIYKALDNDNHGLVIRHCKEAILKNTPYKAECLGILSRQYFDQQRYSEAKRIYISHQDQANCQWAIIGLGKIALQENNLNKAEKLFKLLIEDNPLYLSSYDWLAITYEEQFHFLLAEDILEKALKLSPRSLIRLQKYASICLHNSHYDKATIAYENNYRLAQNSIHHCADNTINYVNALIEHAPSLTLVEAKKENNKALSFLKKMSREFKSIDVKLQSHFLGACLYEISKEHELANEEMNKGEKLLTIEMKNIPKDKITQISATLKKLNRHTIAQQLDSIKSDNVEVSTNRKERSLKDRAQADINLAITLYNQEKYDESISKLEQASQLYPDHIGIKLNLIQIMLISNDKVKLTEEQFHKANILLTSIEDIKLTDDELTKLKNLQKKYQLVAGI